MTGVNLNMVNRRILALTWANCAWQIVFAFGWLWARPHIEARWGETVGTVVQGAAILGPTLVVAVIVLRWMRRMQLWP